MANETKNLVEHFRKDPVAAEYGLREAFKGKHLRPADFDLGRLFVECFGYGEFQACRSDRGRLINKDVSEAAGAVTTNAFTNITGQIVYNALMEGYEAPNFVFKAMIPEVMTQNLQGEKVAGIKWLGDEAQIVAENDPYPLVGTSEDYLETPVLQKRGFIVPVSREAILADRTGLLLQRCNEIGTSMGFDDERRAINCIVDRGNGAVSAKIGGHRYHFRGDSIATYGDVSGTHTWDNLAGSNGLLNWTNVEAAELLLDAMPDAGTGEINGMYRAAATHLIVGSANLHTAKNVMHLTEIRTNIGGYPVTGNPVANSAPSPIQSYQIVSSPLIGPRLQTNTDWFLGNVGRAFRKMVAWKNEVTTAPAGNHEEYTRDVVFQVKSSQMDAYATFDPRFMVRSTA